MSFSNAVSRRASTARKQRVLANCSRGKHDRCRLQFVGAALTIMLLSGCANLGFPRRGPECSDLNLRALPEKSPRLDFEAVSVVPPQGSNWCIVDLDREKGGQFAKNTFGGRYLTEPPALSELRNTLFASVTIELQKAPTNSEAEFRQSWQWFWAGLMSAMPNGRIVKRKIERDEGRTDAMCARIEATVEGAISHSFPQDIFVLEVRALVCKHPTRPLLIGLGSSERYLKKAPPSKLLTNRYRKELKEFFDGLSFRH